MHQDSFSGRYVIKLSSSIVIAAINAIIQLLLPRALSVETYGMYSYNLNIFTSVVILANLSTSNAMVSKLAQRNKERGIIYFYLQFFFIISVILNIFVIGLYVAGDISRFFKGQTIYLVLLGLNAAVLNKLLSDVISMYDAMAISRFPAILQVMLKVIMCICISAGYFIGTLNLYVFYLLQSIITFIIIGILICALLKEHKNRYREEHNYNYKKYLIEFYHFCQPLILASCWAQLMIIIMNWILMNYAGKSEQAMYGVALQINVVIGYVFSPYAELLKREFAVIEDNEVKIQYKLYQSLQHMYWLAAYFSIYIFLCADWIVPFLFGDDYIGAITPTRIIMIYTLYQAWGQVGGSFLLATERTKRQALFTSISQTLILLCVLIFQIPNIFFPKGLGAEGIALNYMVSNFLSTVILISYCINVSKIRYRAMIGIQVQTLFICIVASCIGKLAAIIFASNLVGSIGVIMKILISGTIYTVIIMMILWIFPEMIGLTRERITEKLRRNK